jgi:16S rRNA (guanine527-N7)-methyltransferase
MDGRLSRQREPLPTRVEDLPDLPSSYGDALAAGLDALRITLDPGARAAIDGHIRLLLAWTTAINLTSVRDPAQVARRHVLDSLAALELLRSRGIDRFLDVGSGGGFPGLPLAAAMPAAEALLVEAAAKKARFLATVVAATGLLGRVRVVADRAEALARAGQERGRWPAVTARAVGALAELIELALPLMRPGGHLVAWKRGDLAAELDVARRASRALGGGALEMVPVGDPELAGHVLVVVTKRRATPPAFPRDPALRKRRPW